MGGGGGEREGKARERERREREAERGGWVVEVGKVEGIEGRSILERERGGG